MLENMKLLGKGNTAEVFDYGNKRVCKLFYEGYPDKYVALEFRNSKEMYKNRIKIPKPFQMITIENRKGIIYERIDGKTLLNIMMENETNLEEYLNIFVILQLDFLAHHTKNVLSYKEYLIAILKNKKINNQVIFNTINSLPDDDCLLHGDLHPNNILIMSDGTPVIIDFMNVCRGPAVYDIARTYFLIKQFDGSLADKYLKCIDVSENDIAEYLNIIEFYRQYES
ncbi:MAG: phosphotransferase [Clostridiales bacterium]|nr:phosphotransferase [Clostridiales bacterium]